MNANESKIQNMVSELRTAGFEPSWYSTGGGCMVVRIALGDDQTDWSGILIGEGGPTGPDSFGSDDLNSDENVSGIWFASTEDSDGEPVDAPLLLAGDTAALISAIRTHVSARTV